MAENNERNALAELADVLAWFVDESQDNDMFPTLQLPEAISKAHRIIAELAKVQNEEDALFSMKHLNPDEARRIAHQRKGNCILKCRAIAEEGNSDAQAT